MFWRSPGRWEPYTACPRCLGRVVASALENYCEECGHIPDYYRTKIGKIRRVRINGKAGKQFRPRHGGDVFVRVNREWRFQAENDRIDG